MQNVIDTNGFLTDRAAVARLEEVLRADPRLSDNFQRRLPFADRNRWIIRPAVMANQVKAIGALRVDFLPAIEVSLIGRDGFGVWRFYPISRRIPDLGFLANQHPATAELLEKEWCALGPKGRIPNKYAASWLREFCEIWVGAIEEALAVPHHELHCDNPDSLD